MDIKELKGIELSDEEMNQVSGGATITDDVAESIAERKVRAASPAAAKAPAFKAKKGLKDGVK